MKLRRDDKVLVISGRDKGKTGKILSVLPAEHKVVVESVNIAKRHTKPTQKQPRGGILEITRPIDVAKVMVLDPQTGKPARVGYTVKADGTKERIFKVSPNHTDRKPAKAAKAKATETTTTKAKAADKGAKAGKK
jgi:large subunit ribosomal protein L24